MTVMGGMGTYGAVIGATLFVLVQSYPQVLMRHVRSALAASSAAVIPEVAPPPDYVFLWRSGKAAKASCARRPS